MTYDGIRLASPIHDQGSLAIHERVPLRPVVEMITEHARTVWRAKEPPDLGPTLVFRTYEGEYACQLPVRFTGPNGPEGHWVAFVIGDESAVLIDGTASLEHWPEMKDRIHALAENYLLALGEVRRRKFEYVPPAGWNGLRRPTSTWWYHPDYPRQLAIIKVFDARPATVNAPEILDRVLFVDSSIVNDEPPAPPIAGQTPSGLMGYLVRGNGTLAGVPVTFAAAYYSDERFSYFTRLEAHREVYPAAAKVMGALVDSIVALPRNTLTTTVTNLIHWIE